MTGIVRLVMVALDLLAIVLFVVAASAWRRRYRLSSSVGFLAGAVCLLLALLCGAITVGGRGSRGLPQGSGGAPHKTAREEAPGLPARGPLPRRRIGPCVLAGGAEG